jgi:hypothetical protein
MVTLSPINSSKDSMHWSSVTMFLLEIMVALNSLSIVRNRAFNTTNKRLEKTTIAVCSRVLIV